MRIRVQVIIEADQESAIPLYIEEVACLERGSLSPETLGLRLDEAKQLLAGVQQIITTQQSANSRSLAPACIPVPANPERLAVGVLSPRCFPNAAHRKCSARRSDGHRCCPMG